MVNRIAGDPASQFTCRLPDTLLSPAVILSLPKSSLIFRRFGLIVSILTVCVNCAPPTLILAIQLPVGASGAVAVANR